MSIRLAILAVAMALASCTKGDYNFPLNGYRLDNLRSVSYVSEAAESDTYLVMWSRVDCPYCRVQIADLTEHRQELTLPVVVVYTVDSEASIRALHPDPWFTIVLADVYGGPQYVPFLALVVDGTVVGQWVGLTPVETILGMIP